MAGREVCYHHGGASLRGPAHPNYKHGRYAKDLPTRLAARYAAALADPELLSLRDDVAVVDARVSELIAGLDRGEAGTLWLQLGRTRQEMEEARIAGDTKTLAVCLNEVDNLIQRGATEAERWRELLTTIDRRRVLVESERERLAQAEQMLTAKQAMLFVGVVQDMLSVAVEAHVADRRTRATILAEVAQGVDGLLGSPVQGGVDHQPER